MAKTMAHSRVNLLTYGDEKSMGWPVRPMSSAPNVGKLWQGGKRKCMKEKKKALFLFPHWPKYTG
jgi:hypothetical protein